MRADVIAMRSRLGEQAERRRQATADVEAISSAVGQWRHGELTLTELAVLVAAHARDAERLACLGALD